MRAIGAGFGLLSLLIVVAIMLHMWSSYNSAVAPKAQEARDKASQISGYDADTGAPAKDSVKLDPFLVQGKLKYVLVDSVVPGGAFEKYFGLKQNDSIIATGSMDFRDVDASLAVDLIYRAYQTKDTLIIMREGQKMTLPLPGGTAPAAPAAAPAKKDDGSSLQKQLDAIPGIR